MQRSFHDIYSIPKVLRECKLWYICLVLENVCKILGVIHSVQISQACLVRMQQKRPTRGVTSHHGLKLLLLTTMTCQGYLHQRLSMFPVCMDDELYCHST